jgi:hypothetical protein
MNRRYIELTREQLDNAQRQTKILVQPNLDISSLVEGLEYAPGRKFYRARITVKNKGAYPVQIAEAHVSGGGVAEGNSLEYKLHKLVNCAIPAGGCAQEDFRVDNWLKSDEDLGPFRDFLTTTITCRDLTGLCVGEYCYQPVTGLSYRLMDQG